MVLSLLPSWIGRGCNGKRSLLLIFLRSLLTCSLRDAPNAWPPHQYIIMSALGALPSNLTTNALPTPGSGQSTYDLIPSGQLNFTEAQLPGQSYHDQTSVNVTATGPGADVNRLNGTVVNGGNVTAGEGWAATLRREMANRYFTSVLCSW